MVVISKAIIKEFSIKYPSAERPLMSWYDQVKSCDWANFSDLKKSFNSADVVANDRYVFNIKGNQFRLIALIIFKTRTVFILYIGTHSEYDKIDVSTIQYKK